MTTPDITRYRYNNNAQRWVSTTSGRFVSNDEVNGEMRRHQEATFSTLDGLTRQLYGGNITLEQWQLAVASELKDAHLAQSMFAVGGKANMTQANYGRVGGVLADEYRYLSRFAYSIANGTVSEAQALARIRQYGRATQQSYWREFALESRAQFRWQLNPAEHCGDCVALSAGGPYTADTLPTYPGAGDTACRGNCNCTLERI